METFEFTIRADNSVFRIESAPGVIRYDSSTAVAEIDYGSGAPEIYVARNAGAGIPLLVRRVPAFDFSGDGVTDSLILTFVRDP